MADLEKYLDRIERYCHMVARKHRDTEREDLIQTAVVACLEADDANAWHAIQDAITNHRRYNGNIRAKAISDWHRPANKDLVLADRRHAKKPKPRTSSDPKQVRQTNRRQERRRLGLCGICGKVPAEAYRCDECEQKHRIITNERNMRIGATKKRYRNVLKREQEFKQQRATK